MSSLLLLASLTSFHSSSIPPFLSPSAERILYEIFFLPFLKSRFVGFLKGSGNSRWNTQWLSLTFEPLFYRSFDLLHDKGGYNIIRSCRKKLEMFPDTLPLPPCLQLLKSLSDLERPGCEDCLWPDRTATKESWFRLSIALQRAHHPPCSDHQMWPSIWWEWHVLIKGHVSSSWPGSQLSGKILVGWQAQMSYWALLPSRD